MHVCGFCFIVFSDSSLEGLDSFLQNWAGWLSIISGSSRIILGLSRPITRKSWYFSPQLLFTLHSPASLLFFSLINVIWDNQVSPLGRMGNDELGPPWLIPMLGASYFISCSIHGDSNKSECNMFCLDCMGRALCSYCLINHKDHRVVQVWTIILFPLLSESCHMGYFLSPGMCM